MNRIVGHIRDTLIIALLTLTPAPILAGETVEIHGVLRETASGVILVTTATNYVVRGIDASGLGGCRAIVLGSREMDNGMDVIDAQEIKIAQ
ncbi:MAG: hypothetical protein Q4B25_01920 [Pseudomonadota bacterium]|nr:hypothetical protein [Pseudomonadota bacterium]